MIIWKKNKQWYIVLHTRQDKKNIQYISEFSLTVLSFIFLKKSFITTISLDQHTLSHSINIALSAIISKDVQLLYSARGKPARDKKKESFIKTETYKCLKGIYADCLRYSFFLFSVYTYIYMYIYKNS